MLTTPIFGIPYAERDDPAREYPETVNAPAMALIEGQLAASARDTGWRNIVSLLTNGWILSAGSPNSPVLVRRVGALVMTSGLVSNTATPASMTPIIQYPVGFRSKSAFWINAYSHQAGGHPIYWEPGTGGRILLDKAWPGGSSMSAFLDITNVLLTSDAWPTTLPGTPQP